MAILFRTVSSLTIGTMEARLTVYGSGSRLRVELEPYDPSVKTVYPSGITVTVTYGSQSEILQKTPFDKPVNALFDSVDGVQSIRLSSSAGITYRGTTAENLTISWKGDGSVPAPAVSVSSCSGFVIDNPVTLSWRIEGVPEGYTAYTVGLWLYYATSSGTEPNYVRSSLLTERTRETEFSHTFNGAAKDHVIRYRIAVALYKNAADAVDDYVAYTETDSSSYVYADEGLYRIPPCNLQYGNIMKKRKFTITWDFPELATEVGGVYLDYAVNGEKNWNTIYSSTTPVKSYTCTITKNWTSIAFRIHAYSTRSRYEQSPYQYGQWVPIGTSNLFVGRNGKPVPASMIQIGQKTGSIVLQNG